MEKNKIIVLDRGDYTTCTVNLHGATVTSWRIRNQEQLFVSRQSHSHELSHIIGGIQLTFPHFGVWSFGPRHGFARSLPWVLEEGPKRLETEDVVACFRLCDDPYTHALWGYKFKLLYIITLCKFKLTFKICVENPCKNIPFDFHITQHSLFRVPDVSRCEISGLQYRSFKDMARSGYECAEGNDDVTVSGYTNKLYRSVQEVKIQNMMNGGVLQVNQRHTTDFNLWNPGGERSSVIPDLDNDEYKYFIAVGTGSVLKAIRVQPSSGWSANKSFEFMGLDPATKKKDQVQHFYDYFKGYC